MCLSVTDVFTVMFTKGLCDNRGENQGFLSIAFPDEMCDSIVWTVLPVKPDMTARDVCQ